jgi:hypothetical protein
MRIDYGGADTYPYHGTLLGCRHGRILILDPRQREVLVCDPITGDQRRIAVPPGFGDTSMTNGAVLCSDDYQGHVHGGCHSSPFKVVLVHIFYKAHEGRDCVACVYSSKTRIWSSLIWAPKLCVGYIDFTRPSTLVGGSLFWWLHSQFGMILEFDISRQTLSVIDRPPVPKFDIDFNQIIQGEHGSVGVATLSYPSLQIWDWKADSDVSVATWTLRKTVHLELLPNILSAKTEIVGYVEDDDAILIMFNSGNNVFILHLESMRSSKLCENAVAYQYHPFTSFYSSGIYSSFLT